MKKLLALFIFTVQFILLSSCSKNDQQETAKIPENQTSYESTGTITGFDMALGVCSGGYKLIIDNVVLPTNVPSDVFRFDNLPVNSNIHLNTATFPLNVKINWTTKLNVCGGSQYHVIIDNIILN